MNEPELRTCRVCGLISRDFYPWGQDGTAPSFDICECCFTEFGYDDLHITIIRERREDWIEKGCKWHDPTKKPENWSADEQLKNVPEVFK